MNAEKNSSVGVQVLRLAWIYCVQVCSHLHSEIHPKMATSW